MVNGELFEDVLHLACIARRFTCHIIYAKFVLACESFLIFLEIVESVTQILQLYLRCVHDCLLTPVNGRVDNGLDLADLMIVEVVSLRSHGPLSLYQALLHLTKERVLQSSSSSETPIFHAIVKYEFGILRSLARHDLL